MIKIFPIMGFLVWLFFGCCFGQQYIKFPNYVGPDLKALSGYSSNRLFYVLFENNPTDLLIWIQGGPGCSGLFGMMSENGPVESKDGKNLSYRETNWMTGLNVSLLFLEQPLNTGFSKGSGNVLTDLEAAEENALFLEEIAEKFPSFSNWIIAGESHGGLYVPLMLKALEERKSEKVLEKVKAVTLGNPRLSCSEEKVRHFVRFSREVCHV